MLTYKRDASNSDFFLFFFVFFFADWKNVSGLIEKEKRITATSQCNRDVLGFFSFCVTVDWHFEASSNCWEIVNGL